MKALSVGKRTTMLIVTQYKLFVKENLPALFGQVSLLSGQKRTKPLQNALS